MRKKGLGSQKLLGNQSTEEQRGRSYTLPAVCLCVSPRTGLAEGGVVVVMEGGSGGPCVCL